MNPLDIILKKEPYIQLMVEDGAIYEFRNNRKGKKVMETAEIQLIEKLGYSDNKSDLVEYKFRLNSFTCPIWRELFQKISESNAEVKIHGSELDLKASIEEVESEFKLVKKAIQLTNKAYQDGKSAVLDYAKKQEAERAKKDAEKLQAEQEKQNKIQHSYEKLNI
ncbi:hypothetical protein Pcar_0162 [Syntrophotalea carbinolica DSM 2380]|uniref:Uncharacterized protein n=1 Tax=Syntrophotalea carbinolica (strain DSM 2380 / NBRC 103641 / GraBd1) TaxID=338963 RepID=Q3A869_SYNC1|nr:hypothetical protein [Syntrophotalea carbinolica]ABA87423.2 hypothetical protein Pcar_0162 [Syntrophotalea carbinolica DSM 2380]